MLASLKRLSFERAVWFFPAAFSLHVLEEICCFTEWAQKYASPGFAFNTYLKIHIAGIVSALLAALILSLYPNRILIFLFFAFMFVPAAFWNVFFHAGATIFFGVYCPGLITALIIYWPLLGFVSSRALHDGHLSPKTLAAAIAIAGPFHLLEVGHNVFNTW